MAKDFNQLAKDIVAGVGGEQNVESLTHCVTRLRFVLKDESLAKDDEVSKLNGVLKVMHSAGQYQVVIGTDVGDAYDAVMRNFNIRSNGSLTDEGNADSSPVEETGEKKKKKPMDVFVDMISGIFLSFMGPFTASGLLKGILVLVTTLAPAFKEGTTYQILYAAADGIFYFMPFFLAYTSGKKFGVKPFMSMAIAAALLYPDIATLHSSGDPVTFFGIPVQLISYSSTVLPIICAVAFQSVVEKFFDRHIHKMFRGLFTPLLTLLIVVPLTFIVVGPVTNVVGQTLASAIQWLLNAAPLIGGFAIAALWPVMIIFGVHWGMVPIVMNNHATLGYDMILPLTVGCNFGIAAACFAVFLRSRKDNPMKEVSGAAAISAFVGGVTEPGVYGVLLKNKKLFAAMCIFNGIGGAIGGVTHMTRSAMISVNALTIPTVAALYGPVSLICIAISLVGTFAAAYFFLYKDIVNA